MHSGGTVISNCCKKTAKIVTVTYCFPLKQYHTVGNNAFWAIFLGSLLFPIKYCNILQVPLHSGSDVRIQVLGSFT